MTAPVEQLTQRQAQGKGAVSDGLVVYCVNNTRHVPVSFCKSQALFWSWVGLDLMSLNFTLSSLSVVRLP